jgi:hypothetical protein
MLQWCRHGVRHCRLLLLLGPLQSPSLLVLLPTPPWQLFSLSSAVSGLGYTVWMSAIAAPRRCIAVLARRPAVVVEYKPGYVQCVDALGLTFLHLHCFNDYHERENLLQQCRRLIDSLLSPPFLIGDFNCVLEPFDVQPAPVFDRSKLSPVLRTIVAAYSYSDVFCCLFPNTVLYNIRFFAPTYCSPALIKCMYPRYLLIVALLLDISPRYLIIVLSMLSLRRQDFDSV